MSICIPQVDTHNGSMANKNYMTYQNTIWLDIPLLKSIRINTKDVVPQKQPHNCITVKYTVLSAILHLILI